MADAKNPLTRAVHLHLPCSALLNLAPWPARPSSKHIYAYPVAGPGRHRDNHQHIHTYPAAAHRHYRFNIRVALTQPVIFTLTLQLDIHATAKREASNDQVIYAYPAPRSPQTRDQLSSDQLPLRSPAMPKLQLGKSRRRTAYPQQIVTTRLLYCLQDRFAQLSRLQRI